ncbi:Ig-like domain-containing protein, partial [Aeromonas sanarellii]|uniref:Ig-like domain-containing protein n=1 Tax=Aeromonas sanarellii TaxID=633415 RepID=UPI003BA2B548
MKLVLIKKLANGRIERIQMNSSPEGVVTQPGVRYELIDEATGQAPKGLKVIRKGKALELEVDGEKVVVLEEFTESDAVLDITTSDGSVISLNGNSPALAQENGIDVLYGAVQHDDAAAIGWPIWAAGAGLLGLGGLAFAPNESGGDVVTLDTTAPDAPTGINTYADDIGAITDSASTSPVTDDSRPGFNVGTGLTDKPSLYVDGVEVPATYDPVTGTLTPNTPLADGTHAITWTLTDAAGNESKPSVPFDLTVDTVADAPTDVVVGDKNADGNQDVSGKGTPGDTVVVTWPDGTTSTGTVGNDGTWKVDVPPTVTKDGPIEVVTKDPAGNESTPVVVTPPSTPAAINTYADNVGAITDSASTSPVTDDSRPGFNVGTGLTDKPSLYVDGVEVPATYDPVTGTLTPNTPLADGTHAITWTLTDAAGNESKPSVPFDLTVDTSGSITQPDGGRDPLAGKVVAITGITDDTGASATDFY